MATTPDHHHRHRGPGARRRALRCCPACAATVGAERRPRRARPPAWLGLLGAAVAMVPMAALTGEGDEPTVAHAAPHPEVVMIADAPPLTAIPAAAAAPRRLAPARIGAKGLAQEGAATARVAWRQSRAIGTPNAGRLENGIQLPARGRGFYTYNPATQEPPGGSGRRWGTERLVSEVLDLGEWWARTQPNQPRLGIGDLSKPHGGYFPGPGVGHASHQNGLDVDIRLPRRDGVEGAATAANYDRELTQAVVDRLVARGAQLVLIGPNLDLHGPAGVVMPWPAHDDHLHVRFPE